MKTGGGQKIISASPLDERVHGLIQESINPLRNPFDSDKIADVHEVQDSNESILSTNSTVEELPSKKTKITAVDRPKDLLLQIRQEEHKMFKEWHEMKREKHEREGVIHELTVKK